MEGGNNNNNVGARVNNRVGPVNNDEISWETNKSEVIDEETGEEIRSPYTFEDMSRIGMLRIGNGTPDFELIRKGFLSGMGSLAKDTTVVAVHKNLSSASITMQAKMESFRVFSEAMARKYGGDANVKLAWFGTTRAAATQILLHGFSRCELLNNDDVSYGVGVHLAAKFYSLDGALSSIADESGLRHVIMCRAILGRWEQVCPGSKQILPTSKEFNSGVDNLVSPTRYIVWGAFINTHILPEFLISYTAPGIVELQARPKKLPSSAWMSFPTLISTLSRYLHPARMGIIVKSYNDFRANRISRKQLVQRVRQLAADQLLMQVIRSSNPNNPLNMTT